MTISIIYKLKDCTEIILRLSSKIFQVQCILEILLHDIIFKELLL